MLIKVKVFPNSKKEEIIKKSEASFEIRVKEKPERGLANKATIRILSSYFNISESKIRLIKGFKEKNKIFEITEIQSDHEK
jgi:uncharacterized protein YggU (UPF0235/DUF167 family)